MTAQPLAAVRSLKVKLGLLVVASVVVAAVVATLGDAGEVPVWLSLPVTVLLALAVTQLLAVGMTSPLREMTTAARRMARGDHDVRVDDRSGDEVGELARAFNRMAGDLAGVERQRRELVANVSHELRTPLAGLRALLENLVDGVGPTDPTALGRALAQAERLGDLVDDLLELARVDAGKAPLSTEPVPVARLLADAVDQAQVSGRPVHHDIRVDPPGLEVPGDPARLHQLVANLLDNASRHSPAGGTVTVTARRVGEVHRLEVADTGPGIAAEDRDRAFERFGTLTGSDGGGGTGLGLAIARWVTELHGGRIGFVEPLPGSTGARVRVDLPVVPATRHGGPSAAAGADTRSTPTRSTPTRPAPTTPAAPPSPATSAVPVPSIVDDLFGTYWPDRGVPGRRGLLLGSLGVGLLAATVLPHREVGLATFLVLLAAGGVVLAASRRRRDPFTLTCAALCVLLATTTVIRDADWLVVLCLLAGGLLCVCGVTGGRTLPGFVVSGLAWPLAGLRGLPWLGRTLGSPSGHLDPGDRTGEGESSAAAHGSALVRTAVWSVIGLVVFGLLFASADALFAQWATALLPEVALDSFVLRAFVAVAVGGAVLAAAYLALNPPRVDRDGSASRPAAHRFEWLAPVLVVDAVFAAFLAAQVAVFFGGHDYLQATTGLTYAEYVHQGFGQLTVATGLTLLVIWAAARKAPRETVADRSWLRIALGLLCVQTLVVVASALYRMHVYQEAYGFTELRLLVDLFEGWLGLLVLAAMAGGIGLRARWLPRFALLSGVVLLLGLAAINPGGWIAERNLDRYQATGELDWRYLQQLSDDAVPVLARAPQPVRPCVLAHREPSGGAAPASNWLDWSWLDWNWGRARAAEVLAETEIPTTEPRSCPESPGRR